MATKKNADQPAQDIEDMIQSQIIFANKFGREVTEIRLSPPLMKILVEYIERTVVYPPGMKAGLQVARYMGFPLKEQASLCHSFPVEIHCQPLLNTSSNEQD